MTNKLNRRQGMKIFNFLDGKGQMFVFGIIVVVLLTSGIGVVESRVALVEGDLEDMEEDALWESAQKKCLSNRDGWPEFNQDEYLAYLKKVEEANPGVDRKVILAALHAEEYPQDVYGALPLTTIPVFQVSPFPLFQHGDETAGWGKVNLLCEKGPGKEKIRYNPPKYVYDKNCQKIDIAHSYAGPRSDLGRGNGIGDLLGLWPWFMRRANTNWGDTVQSVGRTEGVTGWSLIDVPLTMIFGVSLGVMKVNWDPPEQYAGDYMGLWLSDYYRNPKNQNTPLSSAYKEYFDSQSGKRVCNNEEVCKKAGYYWYDDQCYEEPEYKKEKKCDVSHLNLCDNKYDCENVGRGYWYYDQCNMDPENKCDFEHLNLCKNEKDCDYIGRYWYDNQCNENPEKDTSAGDTSGGEFDCPIPIPKGAKHIVTDYEDYWVRSADYYPTRYNAVGPYKKWYDKEKTKKREFACRNNGVTMGWYEDGTLTSVANYKDGKLHGVLMRWYKDGTPHFEYNYKDGKKHGVQRNWHEDGTLWTEYNYKEGKLHGVQKMWGKNGTLYETIYENGKQVY